MRDLSRPSWRVFVGELRMQANRAKEASRETAVQALFVVMLMVKKKLESFTLMQYFRSWTNFAMS